MSDAQESAETTQPTPDQMYNEALKLRDTGDLEGTVAALRKILESAPDHLHTHLALAVYLQKLGQPEQAIVAAQKAVELDPQDAFSFTQLSVIYQRCGRIMEAEEAMAKAHAIQGRTGHHH
ncbi:MAG: tetratricopeptide repeat protein [Planctomycetaceae bacterium]|nr:tetratricopeptide repeat protein [Planctomycetaceae bacterium]